MPKSRLITLPPASSDRATFDQLAADIETAVNRGKYSLLLPWGIRDRRGVMRMLRRLRRGHTHLHEQASAELLALVPAPWASAILERWCFVHTRAKHSPEHVVAALERAAVIASAERNSSASAADIALWVLLLDAEHFKWDLRGRAPADWLASRLTRSRSKAMLARLDRICWDRIVPSFQNLERYCRQGGWQFDGQLRRASKNHETEQRGAEAGSSPRLKVIERSRDAVAEIQEYERRHSAWAMGEYYRKRLAPESPAAPEPQRPTEPDEPKPASFLERVLELEANGVSLTAPEREFLLTHARVLRGERLDYDEAMTYGLTERHGGRGLRPV